MVVYKWGAAKRQGECSPLSPTQRWIIIIYYRFSVYHTSWINSALIVTHCSMLRAENTCRITSESANKHTSEEIFTSVVCTDKK